MLIIIIIIIIIKRCDRACMAVIRKSEHVGQMNAGKWCARTMDSILASCPNDYKITQQIQIQSTPCLIKMSAN